MRILNLSAIFVIFLGTILASPSTFAQKKSSKGHSYEYTSRSSEFTHEASLSSTYGEFASAGGKNGLQLSGNYKRFINPHMEVGGHVDMVMSTYEGSSNTYIGLWGTFTYNLSSEDLANTYYVTGALGMVDEKLASSATVGSSEKKFSYAAFAGRRFPWMDKLYYTPEVGLRKIGSTDMAIVIIPLNISLMW